MFNYKVENMTTLRKRENQYRTIEVKFESFPENINPRDYEYFGHLQGQRVNKLKGMSIFNFDFIVWFKNSQNTKNEIEFIHCGGFVKGKNEATTIVLRKKKLHL